jgi:D-erythronate 2-dehydrogenase
VTGAAGNVGRYVVRELASRGYEVFATDVRSQIRGARRKLAFLPSGPRAGVEFYAADLTDEDAIASLLRDTSPQAIMHLAAIIPPHTYENAERARRVNVDGTRNLVRAAERMAAPPYFLQASSMAVYGARNPHRHHGLLDADTSTCPTELYGAQKLAAEQVVRSSSLEWSILRLGGVLTPDISLWGDASLVAMEGCLPVDGRVHMVAVEDVAVAFERAIASRPVGNLFLVGGDQTHCRYQHEVGHGIAAAMGLRDVLPPGRQGDPDQDRDWFITDWMDTSRSQQLLDYQSRSFEDTLMQIGRTLGWRRRLLEVSSPLARRQLARSAPYRGWPAGYADPWSVIGDRWGWALLEPERGSHAE